MKANPGGQLEPQNIYGRDELIVDYWSILEGRGIYVNDLRRIGKTQIMVKMHAEAPKGWVSVKADLGGCHSAAEFATRAFRDSHEVLGKTGKALRTMGKLLAGAAGTEIAGVLKLADNTEAPWKEVLARTFADVQEEMEKAGSRMVFFWDEVPFLLDNIATKEGPQIAMEVLDVMRSLAQDHDRVRLFLTGSIGLHHVLRDLEGKGYNGTPLNRMAHEQPGPLGSEDARQLSLDLIRGEGLVAEDEELLASHVAEQTGNVAFYIHKIISRLPKRSTITPASVDAKLGEELTSHDDDWDLKHYRKRLDVYYGQKVKPALAILDAVAAAQPMDFDTIRQRVAEKMKYKEEDLLVLLDLLCRDHYLVKKPGTGYSFYLEIVRRWWTLSRSL